MFDTVHLEIPLGSPYNRDFLRLVANVPEEHQKKFERTGENYHYVRDLRLLPEPIPALLHCVNVRTKESGDKVEFIGAGKLGVGQMAQLVHRVYNTDVDECNLMRLDATADLAGEWVPWCRENVRVQGKQCVQHETPERGGSVREYIRNGAETIYWGRGARQTVVYDKTGERRFQLQKQRRKLTRTERESMTLEHAFYEEYGYSIFDPVTRFERRLGARETATALGIKKFGNIQKAAYVNPFSRMNFPENIHAKHKPVKLSATEHYAVLALQDLIKRDGWANARNDMRRNYGDGTAFYRALRRLEAYLLPTGTGPTREMVRKAYVASTLIQLAA